MALHVARYPSCCPCPHSLSFMAFHVANAYEEGDGRFVKLFLCAMKEIDMGAST